MKKLNKKDKKPNLGDIAKVLGKEWGELSDVKRVVYLEKSKKDKERYEEEMEAYNANN